MQILPFWRSRQVEFEVFHHRMEKKKKKKKKKKMKTKKKKEEEEKKEGSIIAPITGTDTHLTPRSTYLQIIQFHI